MAKQISVTISIDTEEDNWVPTCRGITTANIARLPRLAAFFTRLGVRATYFTTYQVAVDPEASAVLREVAGDGNAEIGAHLHPWNTPPYCGIEPDVSMLRLYPQETQGAKLARLLNALESGLGAEASAFRAGRFGIGRTALRALIEEGLSVDSSVTPLITWSDLGGPSFLDATNDVYQVDGSDDICHPSPGGPLTEVPITVGFTRVPPQDWNSLARRLATPNSRGLRSSGLVRRLMGVRKVILSPEVGSASHMIQLGREMIQEGAPYLHMYFHSNSLVGGLTPFTKTEADVRRLYDSIEMFLDAMATVADIEFCTVSEVARNLGSVVEDRDAHREAGRGPHRLHG